MRFNSSRDCGIMVIFDLNPPFTCWVFAVRVTWNSSNFQQFLYTSHQHLILNQIFITIHQKLRDPSRLTPWHRVFLEFASQLIKKHFTFTKSKDRCTQSLALKPILSQLISLDTFTHHFYNTHYNTIPLFTPRSPLTLKRLNFFSIWYKTSNRTPQETRYVFATKSNRLMLYR
jgi:hypothetical protein